MRKIPWLNIVLFVVTILTTLIAGTYYSDKVLQKDFWSLLYNPWKIKEGIPFSFTIMLILLSHELSHYFASKKHRIEATLPYFIPGPTIIGTFGAVIKIKSPITTRMALIDIGASGPIMGFIISVAAYVIGLSYSEVVPFVGGKHGDWFIGPSILSYKIATFIHGPLNQGYGIELHPVAFAGWVGLLITSLNLIPIGQLDGGHIAYALLGEKHIFLSRILIVVLLVLGVFLWEGWILWAVLMIILGLRHPPVSYWETPIDSKRRVIGWISTIIFIITFVPAPFMVL